MKLGGNFRKLPVKNGLTGIAGCIVFLQKEIAANIGDTGYSRPWPGRTVIDIVDQRDQA